MKNCVQIKAVSFGINGNIQWQLSAFDRKGIESFIAVFDNAAMQRQCLIASANLIINRKFLDGFVVECQTNAQLNSLIDAGLDVHQLMEDAE